jgi:O-antigen/teichoic acid export membrane protein
MNIKQQTIRGIAWSFLQNWSSQMGSLLIFLVMARLLAPESFGLVALANSFLAFVSIFINQGLTAALVQRPTIDSKHFDTAFWVQVCFGLFFSLLGLISGPAIANLFQEPLLKPIIQVFSILPFLESLNMVHIAILRRQIAFQKIAARVLIGILVSGIVGIALATQNFGVWSLIGQQITFEAVGVAAFWHLSDWRPKLRFSLDHLKELYSFGVSALSSNILTYLNQNTDTLLIGYFLGSVALGYYAVAYRVFQVLIQLLVQTPNQVVFPVFARLQLNLGRLINAFYKALQFSSLIAFPIFFGVVSLADELVLTIFGEQWYPSMPIMQVLSLGGMIYFIILLNQSVFIALGHPFRNVKIDILNSTLNIIFCWLAVRWGVLAVAIAYVASDFLVIPVSIWMLKKLLKITFLDYVARLVPSLAYSIAMLVAIVVFKGFLAGLVEPYWILVICTILGVVVYGAMLIIFTPNLLYELWGLRKLLIGSHVKS